MHELSIVQSILEIVEGEMKAHGRAKLKKLSLRVGAMTAVEPDTLRFCFDAAVDGTPYAGAVLEIEEVPLSACCRRCANEFLLEHRYLAACPACGSRETEIVSGEELDVIGMEVE